MSDLLEAIQIFLKYGNADYPFQCTHDTLYVCGYDISEFDKDDLFRLDELGFIVTDDFGDSDFKSYKYGSC